GIRDSSVTGVQTCALPILWGCRSRSRSTWRCGDAGGAHGGVGMQQEEEHMEVWLQQQEQEQEQEHMEVWGCRRRRTWRCGDAGGAHGGVGMHPHTSM